MVAYVTRPKKEKLVGFQADEQMQIRIRERAVERSEGNVSAYLRQLATRDIDAADQDPTGAVRPDVLAQLGTLYGGYFAGKFAQQLAARGVDQAALLHTMLKSLSELMAAGYDPMQSAVAPVSCITHAPVAEHLRAHPAPRVIYAQQPDQLDLHVAEDAAPIPPAPHTTDQAEEAARILKFAKRKAQIPRSPKPPAPKTTGA